MNATGQRGEGLSGTVFAVAFIALLAYLDWVTHREIVVAIVLGLAAAAAVVYRVEIVRTLDLGPTLARMPAVLRPVLRAAPAVLYFLVRGQGTSGAGGIVLVALLLVVAVSALFGLQIDSSLAGFYVARNGMLPRPLRMLLALVAPILVSFLVIHGDLTDLPALFGGTTNHPASPAGREGSFFLGTVAAATLAYLLLREAPRAAGGPVATERAVTLAWPGPSTALVPEAAPVVRAPTHLVPGEGMQAWGAPDPSGPVIADLQAGLDVQVAERLGDWARVVASNGWTGWVDGRRLVERTG